MSADTQSMNPGLYKLHRVFYVAFAAFAVLMLIAGVAAAIRTSDGVGIAFIGVGLLPISVAHWSAAQGAKAGKPYGRLLSRIIGTIWLFGFPIGTILGIYAWSRTGKKWRANGVNAPAA